MQPNQDMRETPTNATAGISFSAELAVRHALSWNKDLIMAQRWRKDSRPTLSSFAKAPHEIRSKTFLWRSPTILPGI
jgi:hypothetical protein